MFGLLDSFTLFDFSPGFGVGRRGRRLLRVGDAAQATIVGIKVSRTGSDSDSSNSNHYLYALDVAQPLGPPVRLGCRQNLLLGRGLVTIGSTVAVRVRSGRVIIDWVATLQSLVGDGSGRGESADWWKPLRTPPEPGITDHEQNGDRRRIAKGSPALATVLHVASSADVFGMGLQNIDVDVRLAHADGRTTETRLRRLLVPDYAKPILTAGRVLPVGVDRGGDRITVDWVRAVNDQAVAGSATGSGYAARTE